MENWSEPAWLLQKMEDPHWSALISADLKQENAKI
jgi:hypothetical protein